MITKVAECHLRKELFGFRVQNINAPRCEPCLIFIFKLKPGSKTVYGSERGSRVWWNRRDAAVAKPNDQQSEQETKRIRENNQDNAFVLQEQC